MANDAAALGSAIYAAIGTAGTAVGLNLYYAMAPQNPPASPPYGIFQRQAALDEYYFNGREISADYVVKVVSDRQWPDEARLQYERYDNAMQDANLNASGYKSVRCRRTNQLEYRDSDGYWHVGALFRVDAVKT